MIADRHRDFSLEQYAHCMLAVRKFADLPGLEKEEVKVKVKVEEGRVLQINRRSKDDKWHRMECSSGKFLHQFRRPENVKVDPVKARMENGVLTVMISKEEANCNRS
ncbi:hypothetical protein ZIOFF_048684 [Zingiber officinale]|uniref:SHSP domain-containing protein n=1 Tax=Zingiber officinale TaxID=94328 RepID=A0A8J5G840_ZINOF|nr:hypothetical protein ZIOFF_048684 [Zingiber officinale]